MPPKLFDAILVINISLVCGMWSMMKNFASSDQILVYSYYIFEMREKGEMHSWQLSYKHLDSLWFSLMALGIHYYVKQEFM